MIYHITIGGKNKATQLGSQKRAFGIGVSKASRRSYAQLKTHRFKRNAAMILKEQTHENCLRYNLIHAGILVSGTRKLLYANLHPNYPVDERAYNHSSQCERQTYAHKLTERHIVSVSSEH